MFLLKFHFFVETITCFDNIINVTRNNLIIFIIYNQRTTGIEHELIIKCVWLKTKFLFTVTCVNSKFRCRIAIINLTLTLNIVCCFVTVCGRCCCTRTAWCYYVIRSSITVMPKISRNLQESPGISKCSKIDPAHKIIMPQQSIPKTFIQKEKCPLSIYQSPISRTKLANRFRVDSVFGDS